MPHLLIEYPQERITPEQMAPLLDVVHAAAMDTGLFDESHIRIRAIPFTHYLAAGHKDPYIHVQCRIHVGRTDEQKRLLSEAVLAAMREQGLAVKVITVEVVEMDKPSYAKWVAE